MDLAIFLQNPQGFFHSTQISLQYLINVGSVFFLGMAQVGSLISGGVPGGSQQWGVPLSQGLPQMFAFFGQLSIVQSKPAPIFNDP
jgi:hypothetical protein